MTRVIDSHQHFWRTDAQEQPWRTDAHDALKRDFLPADLIPELDTVGVDATVVTQSVDEPAENDRLAEFARHDRVAGIIGWLDVRSGTAALSELDRIEIAKLCGVRCLVGRDPLEWLVEPGVLSLFRELSERDLAWDVVPVTVEQVRAVIGLARKVPELAIVVDHLGRPPLDVGGWEPWAGHIAELSKCPNVALKTSIGIDALTAWSGWKASVIQPYVAWAWEQFGAERLMIGSNWPVVLLRATYAQAWNDMKDQLIELSSSDVELTAVLGGTCERVYRLSHHS